MGEICARHLSDSIVTYGNPLVPPCELKFKRELSGCSDILTWKHCKVNDYYINTCPGIYDLSLSLSHTHFLSLSLSLSLSFFLCLSVSASVCLSLLLTSILLLLLSLFYLSPIFPVHSVAYMYTFLGGTMFADSCSCNTLVLHCSPSPSSSLSLSSPLALSLPALFALTQYISI